MPGAVDALEAQHQELRELVARCTIGDLSRPTRCPGWSAADVLLHLAQTNELAVASLEGRFDDHVAAVAAKIPAGGDVDSWADALVAVERTSPAATLHRYETSAQQQLDAFGSVDLHGRVRWVAGEMAAMTLATTRLSETWIHTGDVASALGVEVAPTDRLWHVARLVWRTVPYAVARQGLSAAGAVAFELVGPAGDSWTFGDPRTAATVVRGAAVELCEVAGQRADVASSSLDATGPDAAAVLTCMRTFA